MWVIAKNALRERMRRKELYIVVAVGILILLLCSSGLYRGKRQNGLSCADVAVVFDCMYCRGDGEPFYKCLKHCVSGGGDRHPWNFVRTGRYFARNTGSL